MRQWIFWDFLFGPAKYFSDWQDFHVCQSEWLTTSQQVSGSLVLCFAVCTPWWYVLYFAVCTSLWCVLCFAVCYSFMMCAMFCCVLLLYDVYYVLLCAMFCCVLLLYDVCYALLCVTPLWCVLCVAVCYSFMMCAMQGSSKHQYVNKSEALCYHDDSLCFSDMTLSLNIYTKYMM